MGYKKTLTIILYFLLVLVSAYFIFAFSFGGFGKKPSIYTSAGQEGKTLLFSHRGLTYYYPENSLEGIQGAKKYGFRAIEIDIRRSADQKLIIFHDEDCKRLMGLTQRIDQMTLAEIKKNPILASGKKSDSFVPTVEEVLAAMQGNMVFYFDMKFSSFKDADEVVALIKKHKCERSVILTNWDFVFIFYVEAKYPEIMTGIEGFDAGKEWTYYLMPKDLKPDFLSGFYSETNEAHIYWLMKNDLMNSRIVYGVDITNYGAALNAGFKNIIMDYDPAMTKDPRIADLLKN